MAMESNEISALFDDIESKIIRQMASSATKIRQRPNQLSITNKISKSPQLSTGCFKKF